MPPPFDRVYCVSLPRSTDRRRHATQELTAVGLGDFRFFDATDHDDPLVGEYRRRGEVATFPPCFRCGQRLCDCPNNVLLDPQVATFITFKRLWEEIIRDDVGVALVFEDDIKFTDRAPALLREALTPENLAARGLSRDVESLLALSWARTAEHGAPGPAQFVPHALKMANSGFALTNAFARKLAGSFTAIDTTADIFIHQRVGLAANQQILLPPLGYDLSQSTGAFPSLIRPKPIHAAYLREQRPDDVAAIQAAERRSTEQITRITPCDVLCVGHPRCGSAYMAHLLTAYGLDVGHERLGARGISSWMFAVDDDPYPFARNSGAVRRRDKHFATVIHHVRNPADAIPSIMVENAHSAVSYQFRRRHLLRELGLDLDACPGDVERAARSFLAWNRLIGRLRPQLVVRVEQAEETTWQFLVRQGLIPADFVPGPLPPKDSNTRKPYQGQVIEKPRLSAAEWSNLTVATMAELREFCGVHGYPDPTQGKSAEP